MGETIKKYNPTKEDFDKIEYINLHAHSDLSIKDGIADPKIHFKETITKGHCGCCITDHGSYASSHTLLVMDKELKKKNFKHKMMKGVKEALDSKGKSSHMVVTGCELYIYDDRAHNLAKGYIENRDQNGILKLLLKLKVNPLFSTLFSKKSTPEDVDVVEFTETEKVSKSSKIGDTIINTINGRSDYSLTKDLEEDLLDSLSKCFSNKYNHITVLAKNDEGYKNICRLNAVSFMPDKSYTKPRVSLSDLLQFKEGIIATTGCFAGMIPVAITKGTGEEKELFEIFLNAFGDDFYVEIHLADVRYKWDSGLKDFVARAENPQEKVNLRLLELVKEFGLEDHVYITQDSHLPKKEDKKIQDLLLTTDKSNKDGWRYHDAYYIMSIEEMWEKTKKNCSYIDFETFKLYCQTSVEVAKKCTDVKLDTSVKLDTFKYWLHPLGTDLYDESKHAYKKVEPTHPSFYKLSPEFYDQTEYYYYFDRAQSAADIKETDLKIQEIIKKYSSEYFVKKVIDRSKIDPEVLVLLRSCVFSNRINFDDKVQRRQIFREINICIINGYVRLSPYFAILEEIASWSKRNLYVPGPGRGSAAGSFFNYALNITDINPITRNLSFERFISRERIGYYVLELEKGALKAFIKNHSTTDEFPVEWLENINLLDSFDFTKTCKEVTKRDIEVFKKSNEYEFLKCNPEIIQYFLNILESKTTYSSNINNSQFAWLLGLAPKPTADLSEIKGSMPDIDFDTPVRDETIAYLIRTRGPENVCLVGTYGSLKLKSAIKEVLKLSKKTNGEYFTFEDQNQVSKEIDAVKFSEEELQEGFEYIIDTIIEKSSFIKNFFNDYPEVRDNVMLLAGAKSGIGVHAGGVIVGEGLIYLNPCHFDNKTGCFVSQLDKNQCDTQGLQKIDLLGLSTALEIQDTFHRILKRHGISLFGKLEEILSKEDPVVLEAIRRGTAGLFQIMSALPTSFFKNIQFTPVFNDIPLVQAMYRPGPMGAGVPKKIIKIKNKEEDVTYAIPELKEILEKTYGEIVYQEQIMNICMFLADFTPFEADDIRRAMGKKDMSVIAPYAEKFISGASKKFPNISKENITVVWEKMVKFAEYGFNESHAVSYSSMTYIQAYLRQYYKSEWIAAALNVSSQGNSAKQKETYKTIFKIYKDFVRPPNINATINDYVIQDDLIYLPLYICKGLKPEVTENFIKNAPYKDLFDLYARCDGFLNKKYAQAIIISGAVDSLMPNIDGTCDSVRSQFLFFLKEVILKDFLSSEESEYLDSVCTKIQYNPQIFEEIKDLEFVANAWNEQNFRKFAHFVYFGIFDNIDVKKEAKTLENLSSIIYEILSNPTIEGFNQANVLANETLGAKSLADSPTMSFFDLAEDILSSKPTKTKGKKTSEAKAEKVPSYFKGVTLENIYKEFGSTKFDFVKNFIRLSSGKMILLQTEYLNATTVDFSESFKAVIPRAKDIIGINTIYDVADLEDITTKNMSIIMEVYEKVNFQKVDAIREKDSGNHKASIMSTVSSALNCTILRDLLGKYQSKRAIINCIDYLSTDHVLRDTFLSTIAISNTYSNYKDLFTHKNKVKLKTNISKPSMDWIIKLSGMRNMEMTLDQINTAGYIEMDTLSLINLIFSEYLMREGREGFNYLRNLPFEFDPSPLFKAEKLVITDKVIGTKNIEAVRNALDLIHVGVDLKYIINRIADGMQSEYLNISEFVPLKTIAVAGVIYTPEDNKKFKREQYSYLKKKKTVNLKFSLANRQADFAISLEDCENMKRYEVNAEGMRVTKTVEGFITDYTPMIFMVQVEYFPQDGICSLKVDGEANTPFLPLIEWI